ncbi:MAG: heliorhodopsin HeR [Cryobacterium sp.]|nr:heliorhodopsin HeR [Cryobacterium sp.]
MKQRVSIKESATRRQRTLAMRRNGNEGDSGSEEGSVESKGPEEEVAATSMHTGELQRCSPPPTALEQRLMGRWVARMRILHFIAACAHLAQGVAASVVVALSSGGIWYLRAHSFGRVVFCRHYRLGAMLPLFSFGSALGHFANAFASHATMTEQLVHGRNRIRWGEYSATAGIMLWILATLSGIDDLGTLLLIVAANAALMRTGFAIERDLLRGASCVVDLALGWALHCAIWATIAISFFHALSNAEDAVPRVVWAIAPVLFVLHSSFGAVNIARVLGCASPLQQEVAYVVLSLCAKSLLVWMSVGGALRGADDESASLGCYG